MLDDGNQEEAEPDADGRRPGERSDAPRADQGFVRSALVFYGVLGCVALLWRMWTPGASILHPGASPATALSLWPPLLAGLAVGGASLLVSEGLTRFTRIGEGLADALGDRLGGLGTADAILLALASGVAEEMFFRGALQPAVGIVWASLLFGACHFLPRRDLVVWSAYAVLMGFAFGWLFEATGHLLAPIAAHAVVNGVNLPRLAKRAAASSGGGA